jgi:hypothetical protein
MNPTFFSAFDSIRIISLATRSDRRQQILSELRAYALSPGQQGVAFFDAIRPSEAGGFPSVGARGCFISHLTMLREARDKGVNRLLVLEDDAMFLPELAHSSILRDFCLNGEWDFLYPGHFLPPVSGPIRWIATHENILCTHAYAVHQRVIPKLITFLETCLEREPGDPLGGPMHLDAAFHTFRQSNPDLQTYRTSQSLFVQRSTTSDVFGPSRADMFMPAKVVALIRRFKNELRRIF